jgi:putative membrane protein
MTLTSNRACAIGLALLISAGCSNSTANESGSGPKTSSATASGLAAADRTFADNAAESGEREVEHAKFAQANATSAAVKEYAANLQAAHIAANDELLNILGRKGVTPGDSSQGRDKRGSIGAKDDATTATKVGSRPSGAPSATGTTGASGSVETTGEAIDRERAGKKYPWMQATGAAFDQGFLEAQVKAHQDAIALFDQQSTAGTDAELKAFAAKHLPELRDHLQRAQDLRQSLRKTP